jgi:hypothetical protein
MLFATISRFRIEIMAIHFRLHSSNFDKLYGAAGEAQLS